MPQRNLLYLKISRMITTSLSPYPRVELPLGQDKANINLKPAMVWGVADYVSNVTMLREKLELTGKGVKIGFIAQGLTMPTRPLAAAQQ